MRATTGMPLSLLLAAGLFCMGMVQSGYAQEATPEAMGLPEGISLEVVAAGAADALPPAPATLAIYRATFEPGASFPVAADDPDSGLFVVESGTMTIHATAPVMVSRAGGAAMEQVAADVEFTLGPGDSFVSPPNSGGEFRNDGDKPAVILIAAIEVAPGERVPAA